MTEAEVVTEVPDAPVWGRFVCPDCTIELNYPPGTTHVEHLCYGEPIPEGVPVTQHPENGPHVIIEDAQGALRKVTPAAAQHSVEES